MFKHQLATKYVSVNGNCSKKSIENAINTDSYLILFKTEDNFHIGIYYESPDYAKSLFNFLPIKPKRNDSGPEKIAPYIFSVEN